MAMFITVKAYICDEGGQENQVRKFIIDKDFCSSYNYLVKKLFQMMPELENQEVKITWRDEDRDMITITNDEELMVALMEGKKDHLNIYVTKRRGKPTMNGDIHYGVTCDACECAIRGNRYKCLACPDFDLCLGCEMAGKHNNHKMIRLAKPLEKTIDDDLNQQLKQVVKNKNVGPVYLLNDPRKKFLINAKKELTKSRLINKQLRELPVYHMTTDLKTDLIPKVDKSHRHMMKKVRPATNPLFDTRLPMEEVLKGCCSNLWEEFIAEKDLQDKKAVNKNMSSKSAPKTMASPKSKSDEQTPAENAPESQVVGEEQLKESLKQVLAQIFPNSEFHFVNSELDKSVEMNDSTVNKADNETDKITRDKTNETVKKSINNQANNQTVKEPVPSTTLSAKKNDTNDVNKGDNEKNEIIKEKASEIEKKSVDNEAYHQTDKQDDRCSPVPLTTLAALTALAYPEFVSITTTAPSTQSLPPITKSRNNSNESSNTSLPVNITREEEEMSTKSIQTQQTSDVLSTLEAMGLSNDEGWLSKLVEAKHGDIEKILQALTPTKSAERCH